MTEPDTGHPAKRREDRRFLTGTGRYLDDVELPRETHAVFVRSPHAHASFTSVGIEQAMEVSGVLGVFTGTDLKAAGFGPIPPVAILSNRDGSPQAAPPRHSLAIDRVRHVGDPVAVVIAETPAAARQAADLVGIDYEALPAVTDLEGTDAPDIWDEAPGNLCLDWETGDAAATDAAFARAEHVVKLDITTPRIAANPLETRGAIAEFDAGTGRYTLHVSSQGVHHIQRMLARDVLRIPQTDLRVLTPDVGGGFGTKIFVYPEYAAVLLCNQGNRPSGEMDRIARRELHERCAGARSSHPGGAGARRRRPLSRVAGLHPRQYGRLSVELRCLHSHHGRCQCSHRALRSAVGTL